MREIGKAANAFAKDNGGRFPVCYRMRDTTAASYPYYIPFCISQGVIQTGQTDYFSNDAIPSCWQVYGTSWNAWQQYGGNIGVFSCPSANTGGALAVDLTNSATPEYGAIVWIDYMYVGGL